MDRFLIMPPGVGNVQSSQPKKKRKREHQNSANGEQMFLDIGQKLFGRNTACSKCGMVYVDGQPDDMRRHAVFCRKACAVIKIASKKNLKLLIETEKYSIVEYIGARDRDVTLKRICGAVCNDLGTPLEMVPLNSRIFLCLAENNVAGFINIEGIPRDNCVELGPEDDLSRLLVSTCRDGISVSDVVLGVRQIWVRKDYQRDGVAGLLLDAARRDFICEGVKKTSVAFSQPTLAGRLFAFSYTKKQRILAYG